MESNKDKVCSFPENGTRAGHRVEIHLYISVIKSLAEYFGERSSRCIIPSIHVSRAQKLFLSATNWNLIETNDRGMCMIGRRYKIIRAKI